MDQFKFPKLRGIMSGAAPLGALNSGYNHAVCACTKSSQNSIGLLIPKVEARLVNPDTGRESTRKVNCGFVDPNSTTTTQLPPPTQLARKAGSTLVYS
ncbi:hypothetical protein CcCBS67573_g04291 [Chytriomyces confervae]|uniref:Uncharacterized protein n=1 Tax=Chytriomyces confervae TaxID=246404 RepID=A0A507FFT5_9FUNG|nr:hypothetical protein CcCBS67573_g04291 [Chytriomyces confervae]